MSKNVTSSAACDISLSVISVSWLTLYQKWKKNEKNPEVTIYKLSKEQKEERKKKEKRKERERVDNERLFTIYISSIITSTKIRFKHIYITYDTSANVLMCGFLSVPQFVLRPLGVNSLFHSPMFQWVSFNY